MEIKLPILVQDQMVAAAKGFEPVEKVGIEEDFFLDGPVSRRVAVVDFDENGELRKGAEFIPPREGKPGTYKVETVDIRSDAFMQVNAFGTVYLTMEMFEEADALGRKLTWAFDAPQLLVVPKAGEWANAYYERDSHSLQFFHFLSARNDFAGERVYTSLARDIVAHETAHAVLDGIAPDLYNAITPQSLALHEAVADLAAVLMSMRSRELSETVLSQTNGSIRNSTAFNRLAEEFGAQRDSEGPIRPLRSLLNDKVMPDKGAQGRTSPHALSEVLTGALYTVLVAMHERQRQRLAEKENKSEFSVSGKALFIVREHFKRMIFRALDYLPPGEVSFADYARAVIAADKASHPQWPREREWIANEFARRKIVSSADALLKDYAQEPVVADLNDALAVIDPAILTRSDWAAYDFVERMRDALKIPKGAPYWVRPRLDVTKKYLNEHGGWKDVRECILKVSWDLEEENPRGHGLPSRRQVTVGTMVAIHWPTAEGETPKVRAILTSDMSDEHRNDRNAMLVRLRDEDRLRMGGEAIGPDGQPLPIRSAVLAEMSGDLLRVRSTARMLHIDAMTAETED